MTDIMISLRPHSANSRYLSRRVLDLNNTRTINKSRIMLCRCSTYSWTSSSLVTDCPVKEGPSCIFIGPLETANKDRLEALYHQAKDSYYSGNPLIVDDMFDKVELRLRWYGSKSVVKYPRCSLKRQSTYADAEADPSQVWALVSIWTSILVVGLGALTVPLLGTFATICQDSLEMHWASQSSVESGKSLVIVNGILSAILGSSFGYPVSIAAIRALQGLWRKELVALKGSCPRCGEEVFAFLKADKSVKPSHKTECHVCEQPLVFHAKVEHSATYPPNRWVHGRIYMATRIQDLGPQRFL